MIIKKILVKMGRYDYKKNLSQNGKKAISPVVATALLMVVAVVSVISFQGWFNSYSSSIFTGVESRGSLSLVDIQRLETNYVYVRNGNNVNITFTQISVGGVSCNINGTLLASTTNGISLGNCTDEMGGGIKEVVLITEIGLFAKPMILRGATFIPYEGPDGLPESGAFDGFAWGEHFGFISFNGDGYQVTMTNNQLDGHAYSEHLEYISFNGDGYGVVHSDGALTGYAYSEHGGYINFENSPLYEVLFDGEVLTGHAYSEFMGYIHFSFPAFYSTTFD